MTYSFIYLQNSNKINILTNTKNDNLRKYDSMQQLLNDLENLTDYSYHQMRLTASDNNYTQTDFLRAFTSEELEELINSFESDMKAFGLKTTKIELLPA